MVNPWLQAAMSEIVIAQMTGKSAM